MIAYFGLKRMPFEKDIKPEQMCETYDTKEALSRLSYIRQYRGIMLLSGEPGAGKTAVLRKFTASLNPQNYVHHYTPHATVSRTELYRQLNHMLNLQNRIFKSSLFQQIQSAIMDIYEHQGKTPCIILDEVHLMDNPTLQELILLTNFQMDSKNPFILILAGQPDIKERLKRRIHEPLNQRIVLRYHMVGLNIEETRLFVLNHLKVAGRSDPLFEENAFEVIHQLSMGLPRKIENLCKASMTVCMLKKALSIDADMVLKAASGI